MLRVRLLDKAITITTKIIEFFEIVKEYEEVLKVTLLEDKRDKTIKTIKYLECTNCAIEHNINYLRYKQNYYQELIDKIINK